MTRQAVNYPLPGQPPVDGLLGFLACNTTSGRSLLHLGDSLTPRQLLAWARTAAAGPFGGSNCQVALPFDLLLPLPSIIPVTFCPTSVFCTPWYSVFIVASPDSRKSISVARVRNTTQSPVAVCGCWPRFRQMSHHTPCALLRVALSRSCSGFSPRV